MGHLPYGGCPKGRLFFMPLKISLLSERGKAPVKDP